ncbi:MAG: hydrogenase maturation protease [Labilithrix sp.]|nr:hydrogenase maturation protease [Labilithrix sp.]MCW5815669.1 hydrogenase maturation protease [Labilithrix sp.]
MTMRVLVAGIGNVFFGDDGFGVAVAQHLRQSGAGLAEDAHVVVRDVGIRGLHLAYDLVDGYDLLIAVDVIPSRGAPGTLHLIEPAREEGDVARGARDAHGMDLYSVMLTAKSLGAELPPVLVLGCEVEEPRAEMGMTSDVERAIPAAARMIAEAIRRKQTEETVR